VSSLGGLMTDWLFKTPTTLEGPVGTHRLFEFFRLDKGLTIVMQDSGTYKQIRYPLDEDLTQYPQVYRGGYNYTVDDATKAALIAGNVGITSDNFTEV
jgi:hypothetical protein